MSDTEIFRQTLTHDAGQSEILVGAELLRRPDALAARQAWLADRTLFVVSTEKILELHGDRLGALTAGARRRVDLLVEDGEGAKSLANAGNLWQQMLVEGGKRDSRLLTFGGGTVGDLGGFVAGCFLRGIEYVQLPTTLLAQVDASVGGKTAVDMPAAKNSVGLFHHPVAVLADTSLLATLPTGELRSGLIEAIKKGMVLDSQLLGLIETQLGSLLAGDPAALVPVVASAVAAKCRVVEADAREGDWRRILNFGHTLGHAIESELDYKHLRHGEAVAYGMLFALRLATRRGLAPGAAQRLSDLLRNCDLPPLPPLDVDRLSMFMGRDKKMTEQGLTWVLPTAVGAGGMVSGIADREVSDLLPGFLLDPWFAAD